MRFSLEYTSSLAGAVRPEVLRVQDSRYPKLPLYLRVQLPTSRIHRRGGCWSASGWIGDRRRSHSHRCKVSHLPRSESRLHYGCSSSSDRLHVDAGGEDPVDIQDLPRNAARSNDGVRTGDGGGKSESSMFLASSWFLHWWVLVPLSCT